MDPLYLQYVPAATTERGRREAQGLRTRTARTGWPAVGRRQASGVCGWAKAPFPASLSRGFQPCPRLSPRGMKYLTGIFSIPPTRAVSLGPGQTAACKREENRGHSLPLPTASLTVTPVQQTTAGEGKIRPRDSAGRCPSKARKSMQKLSRG